jgi:hypothetical protein
MGGTVLVVLLAGLVFPILLILTAVLLDALALVWAVYKVWHDDWSHRTWEFLTIHVFSPLSRATRSRQVVPRLR